MKNILLTLYILALAVAAQAQKKPLNHSVYDDWKKISAPSLTADGRFLSYEVLPQEGDGQLTIRETKSGKELLIPRGYKLSFTTDGKYAVALIKPQFSAVRQARIKKVKKEEMPTDSLAIIDLLKRKVKKIPFVTSYKMGEKGGSCVAYLSADSALVSKKERKDKKMGYPLIIHQLTSGTEDTLRYVKEYLFDKQGTRLVAVVKPSVKDTLHSSGVVLFELPGMQRLWLSASAPFYGSPVFDESGQKLAFLTSQDSVSSGTKRCELLLHERGMKEARLLLGRDYQKNLPDEWALNEYSNPYFSRNGERLFVGIAPIRAPKDTTLVPFETAGLDLWHYADPLIQPMQLHNAKEELERTYLSVINLNRPAELLPLSTRRWESVSVGDEGNALYAVARDNTGRVLEQQWTGERVNDVHLVNLNDASRRLVARGLMGPVTLSPGANYLLWYNSLKRHWYSCSVEGGDSICLTAGVKANFWNEMNDRPCNPNAYGVMGWEEDDKAVYLYDAFDIWKLDPTGAKSPVCMTKGEGRRTNRTFRYLSTDPEQRFLTPQERVLLSVFDHTTKQNGYATLVLSKEHLPNLALLQGYSFSNLAKARQADVYLYTKANFNTSPDMYVTAGNWKDAKKISDINPQMKEYNWGTAELVEWTSLEGVRTEGILYKPEGFDPTKKYPVMIYFYERHSDNLYNYFAPAPSRSTVNISFYCSRGYLVFTPDIDYVTGIPGECAYNSIIPGVEMLCKNSWVDRDNMAIQGQSWGGYQVAYLVTRTNLFKAAGAGAPVSNMTSAYGGIRWENGMSRQFQYEHTQSRIGKTLWEAPELYITNSPVFKANRVQTPLLIMHNDADGAVPWYQGIEYFMALRRLGKKVWMLQYNNEEHNLKERRNQKDLTIRLQQFFDYYLKGSPEPAWMKSGIPAIRKGEYFGLE